MDGDHGGDLPPEDSGSPTMVRRAHALDTRYSSAQASVARPLLSEVVRFSPQYHAFDELAQKDQLEDNLFSRIPSLESGNATSLGRQLTFLSSEVERSHAENMSRQSSLWSRRQISGPPTFSGGARHGYPDARDDSNLLLMAATTHASFGDAEEAIRFHDSGFGSDIVEGVSIAAIDGCSFCVSIADPRTEDCVLVAVSTGFESMTGYASEEIIGKNCRFLNKDCALDPAQIEALRRACATGSPFTAVLQNRKKSGELFLNLLDLRGLIVGRNDETGEEFWLLIGAQADVTETAEEMLPENHLRELAEIAQRLRAHVAQRVGELGKSWGLGPNASWRLLEEVEWKPLIDEPLFSSSLSPTQMPPAGPLADAARSEEMRRSASSAGSRGGGGSGGAEGADRQSSSLALGPSQLVACATATVVVALGALAITRAYKPTRPV